MKENAKYETIQKIPQRLKKVEELFDVASEVMEKCTIPEEVKVIPAQNTSEINQYKNENNLPRLFDLNEVRHDFVLARRNLQRLMNRCQTLMDGSVNLDLKDMKAGQVEAIAFLANSINMQIQTVMKLYKDMATIEEMRMLPEQRSSNKKEDKNAAVYIGDSKSLLDLIKENS